jgi:hypothetical protein
MHEQAGTRTRTHARTRKHAPLAAALRVHGAVGRGSVEKADGVAGERGRRVRARPLCAVNAGRLVHPAVRGVRRAAQVRLKSHCLRGRGVLRSQGGKRGARALRHRAARRGVHAQRHLVPLAALREAAAERLHAQARGVSIVKQQLCRALSNRLLKEADGHAVVQHADGVAVVRVGAVALQRQRRALGRRREPWRLF